MDKTIFLQVLASGVIHSLWNFAAKKSSGNLAVNWLAQLVGIAVLLPFALIEDGFSAVSPIGVLCVAAAGVIQAFYFWLLSAAYRTGEISVVYPVARGLGIAGAAVVGVIFFSEVVTEIGGLGILVIAVGTLIIGVGQMRQRGASFAPVIWAIAIGSSLVLGSFVDKTGVSAAPPVTYLCLVYIVSAVLSAPLFLWRYREGIHLTVHSQKRLVSVVGVGAVLSYLIVLHALRTGPLGYILAVREVAVVGGAVLGFVFLSEKIFFAKIVGIAAIVCGIVLIRIS